MTGYRRANDRGLIWFLAASLAVHALVVSAGSMLGNGETKVIAPVYNVKLVSVRPGGGDGKKPKASPRVEKKAPSKPRPAPKPAPAPKPKPKPATREQPKPQPKPVAKPKPKPAPKPAAKTTKPDTQPAAKAKPEPAKAASKPAAATAAEPDFADVLADVQNIINNTSSAGKAETRGSRDGGEGTGGAAGDGAGALAIQIYAGQVQTAIEQNWSIPTDLARSRVAVQIGIKVDGQGRVVDTWIDESSGHSILDESAMRAVRAASPLPPPPSTTGGFFTFYSRFSPQGARSL